MKQTIASIWRKYIVLLRAEWSLMLAYRGESVIWMIGAFIQPLISMSVWLSIGGGKVPDTVFIHYFLGVLLVERLTSSWDVWELDHEIRQGTFSSKLLRPFHPMHGSIAQNLVYKFFFASVLVPGWIVLAMFWPDARLTFNGTTLLGAIVAILLASGIRFLIGYIFGLFSFWSQRTTALFMLYEGIHLFLSGRVAQLELLPDWLVDVAMWLPFYATVGFPVDVLTGKFIGHLDWMLLGLAVQVGWLVIGFVLFRIVWKFGVRRYSAAGG